MVFVLLLPLHMGGILSYGLGSCGLLVLSTTGEAFFPLLALRRRSVARERRPVRVLSFSLRPRLWLIELRAAKGGRGGEGILRESLVGLALLERARVVTVRGGECDWASSSSSSITISITPDP